MWWLAEMAHIRKECILLYMNCNLKGSAKANNTLLQPQVTSPVLASNMQNMFHITIITLGIWTRYAHLFLGLIYMYNKKPFALPLYTMNRFDALKVPSGQIGSTWEWYHCIGLEKEINGYRFFIYFFIWLLNIWKDFKVLSHFMQKWI